MAGCLRENVSVMDEVADLEKGKQRREHQGQRFGKLNGDVVHTALAQEPCGACKTCRRNAISDQEPS